jgi:energy-coupling factor transporter ATP-binding protein EcfA2
MTVTATQTFPRELLGLDRKTRIDYFKGIKIAHPHIEDAKTNLLHAIEDADPGSLIFVFGPSGVGKSTLRISVMNAIIFGMLPELQSDLGRIPVVGMELLSPAAGFFSWTDNFRQLLLSMEEPLIDFKISPPQTEHQSSTGVDRKIPIRTTLLEVNLPSKEKPSTSRYRWAYEQSVKHRRPVAVLLDDAHYLNKVPAARLLYQLDFVKSIAATTQVPHVLFGTYELLALRNLSGQISRRSVDIHLPRYKPTNLDRHVFAGVVNSFAVKMPVDECPNLIEHVDYLMERSGGCVGILKTWLDQSLIEALRSKEKTVTRTHLEKRSYSDEALTKIFMEMVEGEDRLIEGGSQYSIQEMRLGVPSNSKISSTSLTDAAEHKGTKKPRQHRVGTRNPTRDPIGIT